MEFLNLTLQLSTTKDGKAWVEAIESPADRPREQMNLDLDLADFDPASETDLVSRVGMPLFNRLFPESVGNTLQRILGSLENEQRSGAKKGLRIRLRFGYPSNVPTAMDAALRRDLTKIASWPWEYVHLPRNGRALALESYTPLIRSIDSSDLLEPPKAPAPIRILVARCMASDSNYLDLFTEEQRIVTALERVDTCTVKVLPNPCFAEVAQAIEDFQPHIFHFMGHGSLNEETGAGTLTFVRKGKGKRELIEAEELADCLRENKIVRLVVLNSCKGAMISGDSKLDPFHAMAPALLATGLPALIAMQFSVGNTAATEFGAHFYTALTSKEDAEVAMWIARKKVSKISQEWGTAAFYLQTQSGRLFDFGRPDDVRDDEDTVRLAVQSFRGFGTKEASRCDAVLDLTEHFDDRRFIRDEQDWNTWVLPGLMRFLSREVIEEKPLDLTLNAHHSIAFSTGYLLEAKSGLKPHFYQKGQGSTFEKKYWHKDDGTNDGAPGWGTLKIIRRSRRGATDVALVVGITHDNLKRVESYIKDNKLPIRAIVHARVDPPGHDSIRGGAHAYRLASDLHNYLYGGELDIRKGTVHIFPAVPNAFLFYLGQHAAPWGRIQLYEYDLRGEEGKTYMPSILLDPTAIPKNREEQGLRLLAS